MPILALVKQSNIYNSDGLTPALGPSKPRKQVLNGWLTDLTPKTNNSTLTKHGFNDCWVDVGSSMWIF